MQITVNGQKHNVNYDTTLAQIIKNLQIENKVMASAVNMNIVKKDMWKSYILKENDQIELLQFVGGG